MLTALALVRKWLQDRNLYALLSASLLVFTLAYQLDVPYRVQVGQLLDRPYVVNFRPPERDTGGMYRRTRTDSIVRLPGIGGGVPRRVSVRARAAQAGSSPQLTLEVNGQQVGSHKLGAAWSTYTFVVQTEPVRTATDWTLGLHVAAATAISSTPGVAIREVQIESVRPVGNRWEPLRAIHPDIFIIPDPGALLTLTLTVAICYVLLAGLGLARRWSLLAATAVLLGLALLLAGARLYVTIFDPGLAQVAFASACAVALAAVLVPRLYRWGGIPLARGELTLLFVLFWLALLVRLGGVFYPQFNSSDLLYHQHRLERVMAGNLFFLTSSPEFGNQAIPLAPGLYVFLTPLTTLIKNRALLLLLAAVLSDASIVFFLFYLARKFSADKRVGWLAGLIYTFTPITFLMLSAGNIPNLFSQWLLLALVVLVLANYTHLNRPRVWGIAVFITAVAGISHIGNLIVMVTLMTAFALAWWFFPSEPRDRPASVLLLLATGAGVLLAVALYYAGFANLLYGEFVGLVQKKFAAGVHVAGTLNFEKVPIAISAAVIAGGLMGTVLSWRELTPIFRRALGAWLASAALFVGLAQFVGVYVRYNIFVLPALGLGAALGCIWLVRRSRWGYGLVAVYLAYVAWVGISFWFNRVMFIYH